MSGRNGIFGRRGGREAASAPVSDEGAGELLARLIVERDKWKARAQAALAEKRRLAAKVRCLKKRLGLENRPYHRGNFTDERAAQILQEEGYVTPEGKARTSKWISRVRNQETIIEDFPDTAHCTEAEFRLWARQAVRLQRQPQLRTVWRR